MKCLVTGGAGFIGSNLARHLSQLQYQVTVLDNFSSGKEKNLTGWKGKRVDGDVSNAALMEFLPDRFDVIFHQAAITDPRFPDDAETLRQNIEGFRLVLRLARRQEAKLIYASTASLYGNGPSPQQEDQPKELLSAYAQSKLIMDEMACHHFRDTHIVGLRYFNVFGPGEENKGRPASMIYHLTRQMKAGHRPRIFKMGEQKRDHIYVKDCILANVKAMTAPSGIYNVGTGVATSFNEVIALLNETLGTCLEPEYFDMPYKPKTYQMETAADTTRARTFLGFQAAYTLREAIREYVPSIS